MEHPTLNRLSKLHLNIFTEEKDIKEKTTKAMPLATKEEVLNTK